MVQAPTFIGNWDTSRPQDTESRTTSDDYHRNVAESVRMSFPNITSAVTATATDLNTVSGLEAQGAKPLPGVGGQTVVWFYLNTPPPGYDLEVVDTNLRNLTIAPGGATPVGGGTSDGAIDPGASTLDVTVTNVSVNLPANTGGHTLDVTQIPAHNHRQRARIEQGGGGNNMIVGASAAVLQNTEETTADTGGGLAHTHPLGGTASQTPGSGTGSTAAFNPRRAMGVLGRLSA